MDVAIRDAMVPEAGTPDFFRGVKSIGVNAIEIEIARDLSAKHLRRPDGSAYLLTDYQEVDALRRRLADEELRACAFLVATDFTGADAETVRLVTGRVEISDDNKSFRTLSPQGPDCTIPPLG